MTDDGILYTVSPSLVSRSKLLSDMDTPDTYVSVPIKFQTMQWLESRQWPTHGQDLLDIAKATDFLNMEEDLDEACRRVAESLRGRTADEIRKFLQIE